MTGGVFSFAFAFSFFEFVYTIGLDGYISKTYDIQIVTNWVAQDNFRLWEVYACRTKNVSLDFQICVSYEIRKIMLKLLKRIFSYEIRNSRTYFGWISLDIHKRSYISL